jgi:DnaJ like chaperone protein
MSIWGKILGGAAGFALGGPLGALIGAAAGHAVDSMRRPRDTDQTKSIAFTIAIIALGAKLAKVDGVVTRDEVEAFKRVFKIPPNEVKNVGRIFDQARKDHRGYEAYATQVAGMFRHNPAVLEELLYCLAHVARADGHGPTSPESSGSTIPPSSASPRCVPTPPTPTPGACWA